MSAVTPDLAQQITDIASDNVSGASELSRRARMILGIALQQECALEAGVGLIRAQPSMASVWNATLMAVAASDAPETWEHAVLRWERAERTLQRTASRTLSSDGPPPQHIVTYSMSGSVLHVLIDLARTHTFRVSCSEGRPAYEGRRLASTLATAGIEVEFFTDAGLGAALHDADLLLVGADAIGSAAWINKAGTQLLCAAAHLRGCPVYVVTTSDKLVMPALWPHLVLRHGPAGEVWGTPPDGVHVRNPYFEAIPLDLLATVVTDRGVFDAEMVRQACDALETTPARAALDEVLRAFDVHGGNPPS